jgi:hypothetical protein
MDWGGEWIALAVKIVVFREEKRTKKKFRFLVSLIVLLFIKLRERNNTVSSSNGRKEELQ